MSRYLATVFFILLNIFSPARASAGFDHNHGAWNSLLMRHVAWTSDGVASTVDYQGFIDDMNALDAYLSSLSKVSKHDYAQWSEDRQLAFLINAYNAFTVKLITDHWPVKSIRDIGGWFGNPWKIRFFTLLDKPRYLDWIEHDVIRKPGDFNEPRIHFAVNCAAIGCPALRPEAYVGERLGSQLEDQTRRFLSDRSRNRIEGDTLWLSSIFKWYREDFEKGWQDIHSIGEFLQPYSESVGLPDPKGDPQSLENLEIRFLEYDWKLNTAEKE